MRINNFNEIVKQNSHIPTVHIPNPANPMEVYKGRLRPYTGATSPASYAVWVDDTDGWVRTNLTDYVALVLLYTEGASRGQACFRIIRKGGGIDSVHEFVVPYSKRDISSYGEFADYVGKTLSRIAYDKLVRKGPQ